MNIDFPTEYDKKNAEFISIFNNHTELPFRSKALSIEDKTRMIEMLNENIDNFKQDEQEVIRNLRISNCRFKLNSLYER